MGCLVNCFLEGCFSSAVKSGRASITAFASGLSLGQFSCTLVIERTSLFLDLLNAGDILGSFDLGNQAALSSSVRYGRMMISAVACFSAAIRSAGACTSLRLRASATKFINAGLYLRCFNLVDEVFLPAHLSGMEGK